MLKLIISHEARQIVRTGALWSILALLIAAIVFAAWSGGRSIERQVEGAQAAEAFEDGLRNHMREGTEKYEAQVIADDEFDAIDTEVLALIDTAVEKAIAAPLPTAADLTSDVYINY